MFNVLAKVSFVIAGILVALASVSQAVPVHPRNGTTLVMLATFNASNAFKANPSIAKKPLLKLTEIEGGVRNVDTYYGLQLEDPTIGYVLAVFEGRHSTALTSPAHNAKIKNALSTLANGDILVEHIRLNGNPTPVLRAPAVEVISIDLLPGHVGSEPIALFNQLQRRLNEITGKWGEPHWGPVIEDPTKFHFLLGWDSVQADLDSLDDPELQAIFAQVLQIVSGNSRHSDLTKYPLI